MDVMRATKIIEAKVKWDEERWTGELSEYLLHVVETVLSYFCFFSQQKCLKYKHTFLDIYVVCEFLE